MKYFAYAETPPGKVWGLFKDLGGMTPAQCDAIYAGSEYAHTLEIVSAALNGSIATDPASCSRFNLKGYEIKCAATDGLSRRERAKHVLNIVDFSTADDDMDVGFGDVSGRDLGKEDELYDILTGSVAFEQNIRELLGIRKKYLCEQGVDLVSVLYNALQKVPGAVDNVKELVKDENLRELFYQLCDDGGGSLLNRLAAFV
jgi:hypothetical protein